MTRVKICGITNLDDALVAVEAGADYLGFILYPPSKRSVGEKAVQCMVSHLRSLERCATLVGVFVNESAETVADTLDFCDLDLAQLHGDEPPEFLHDEDSPLFSRAYKAIRPKTSVTAHSLVTAYHAPRTTHHAPSLLIDAYHPTLYGGTGETSDWQLAQQLNTPRLMLAGGLTPANVATAIHQVHPFAVDVASGVEVVAGRKDHQAVRTFINNAKHIDPAYSL